MKPIHGLVATLVLFAGCANAQPPADLSNLQKKVDSLSAEMRILYKVLASKGLDVEREKVRLARQDSVYQIPVEGTAILGDAKAPLTVVLFTDLQCPYCAQMAPILKNLQAEHPKSLKVSFRHFPLVSIHDKAFNAHQALWAADRQGRLWDYYFAVAPHFRGLTDSALTATAAGLKLDLTKFEADRRSEASKKAVEADMQLGEAVGVEGTPSLYFNGKPTRNPSEIDAAASNVDAQLNKKK
ncbi:MAG TPA: DsbA family protein [Myxococcota bacterium]|nr:DsbA family protein [Myxococcota bacterium]